KREHRLYELLAHQSNGTRIRRNRESRHEIEQPPKDLTRHLLEKRSLPLFLNPIDQIYIRIGFHIGPELLEKLRWIFQIAVQKNHALASSICESGNNGLVMPEVS